MMRYRRMLLSPESLLKEVKDTMRKLFPGKTRQEALQEIKSKVDEKERVQ